MNNATMRYGESKNFQLEKSPTLIALKPRAGMERILVDKITSQFPFAHGQRPRNQGAFWVVESDADDRQMEDRLDKMRFDAAVSVGTHVYHSSADGVSIVPTGELYVEFAADAPLRECQRLLDQYALQIAEVRAERALVLRLTQRSKNPIKTAIALQESACVNIAEPELSVPRAKTAFTLPNDPHLVKQWYLQNTGWYEGTSLGLRKGADARVVEAWEYARTLGTASTIVAVIDDGFDLSHPDLSGTEKIVAPYDFICNTSNPLPNKDEENWHGTSCAGVAVGSANGIGILGAAPNAKLMPIRGGDITDREVELWFDHARIHGADVVSCSWGSATEFFPLSARQEKAISKCAKMGRNGLGCVIVFSAGNEGRDINDEANKFVNGFALHKDVIAVAASTSRDSRADYTNYGDAISVCAPSSGQGGLAVFTTDVKGKAGYAKGAYADDFGGTSSACPLVAGICALVLSVNPTLKAKQVKRIIEQTARRMGYYASYNAKGHSKYYGYGCVNALAAVKKAMG